MAIEIVDFPVKNCDVPWLRPYLPLGAASALPRTIRTAPPGDAAAH